MTTLGLRGRVLGQVYASLGGREWIPIKYRGTCSFLKMGLEVTGPLAVKSAHDESGCYTM